MILDNSIPKVMVIFLGITLLSSAFTGFSNPAFALAPGVFIDDFVTAGDGGLDIPKNLEFGPDGNLYVLSFQTDEIIRYNGTTGAYIDIFVSSGSGGLDGPQGLVFGPDGNLYVASEYTDEILRYDGTTGIFMDVYVTAGSGGLDNPQEMVFDLLGNLYVTSYFTNEVLRYASITGIFLGPFVTTGSGGLDTPQGLEFGPDGNLYVVSENNGKVLRYNGVLGTFIDIFANAGGGSTPKDLAFGPDLNLYLSINNNDKVKRFDGTSGVFIDNFVTSGSGGLNSPQGLVFGSDDRIYVTSQNTDEILRYEGPFGDAEPTILIATPANGTSYVFGTLVNFTGTSVDPEDGPIHFNITWSSDIDGFLGVGGPPFNNVTLSLGNHTITASSTDSFGNTVTDTVLVNILPLIDLPPTVTISAPSDGSSFNGTSGFFMGDATDPEDGVLTNSIIWNSDLDGMFGGGVVAPIPGLSFGIHNITASVTDSFGNTGSDSITITIAPDVAPTVDITTPVDNDSFGEGTPITFSGTATDPEDGGISNQIRWDSDDDGYIGVGSSITNSSLSVGSHVITASITDSFGNTDSHSHPITVFPVIDAVPTVTISSPSDGDSFVNGTLITLSATANDTEDGDLSGNIIWISDIYGIIGNGSSISSSTAPVGTHVITALVTDSFGNNGSSSITMSITPEVVDASPNVSIITPSEGSIYTNATSVTFTGSANDPEDGDLTASLSWDSNIEGVMGSGGSFTYSNLTVGTHTIEAKATDSFGNIENDSITMIITEDSTELVMVCHLPPGNPTNQQQLMIPITALSAHVIHGDYEGACIDDEEEAKKQATIALVKKQQEEMRNKNELMEKREVFKEIKSELKDLKKIKSSDNKQKLKNIVEDIKEVIKKLNEDPEYDKEHKKIIKNEIKEIKREIVNEIKSDAKISKHKIDSKISKLSKSDNPKLTAKQIGLDFENGKTQIAIELTGKDPTVVELLDSIGKIDAKDDKHVQLTINLSDLPKLRTIDGIENIRPPFSAVQFEEELSEGVYFINADLAQFSGITGKGIKVAVLDLAFTDNPKISDNIVEVKSFRQGIGYLPIQGADDEALHGTAVAEIITDVAPDVQLYLYSIETDIEFNTAVDEAVSKQVDIIVMSAGWPNFPTDGTSHITKKIESAVDNGIAFVVPAGNFANKHWEGNFVDANYNNWHEFSSSDEGLTIEITEQRLSEEKPIIAHLMWDVGMNDVADFELVLVDPLGQIIDYSANEQTTKSDTPFEYIYHVPDIDGIYSIGILYSGDMSDPSERPHASLEVFSVNDDLEYPITQSSVSVPADANGAIVVGAVNHLDGTLEPFSSQGPTNNGKLAPHVVGPDGVTTLSLNGHPFFGTSATAPYVAGLAALIIQTNPDITPLQLLNEIQQNTDNSLFSLNKEFDYSTGYGSANAIFLVEESEVFD